MTRPPDTCSVCSRWPAQCICPWHVPFDKWPKPLLQKLRKLVETDGLPR